VGIAEEPYSLTLNQQITFQTVGGYVKLPIIGGYGIIERKGVLPMSPVKIKKVDGYRVTHGGKVSAKETTKEKAEEQANLLRGVAHGWVPSRKKKK